MPKSSVSAKTKTKVKTQKTQKVQKAEEPQKTSFELEKVSSTFLKLNFVSIQEEIEERKRVFCVTRKNHEDTILISKKEFEALLKKLNYPCKEVSLKKESLRKKEVEEQIRYYF